MGKCAVHFNVTTIGFDAHTHTVYAMERELASIHRVILSAGAGVRDAWERLPRTQYALECRSTHIMKDKCRCRHPGYIYCYTYWSDWPLYIKVILSVGEGIQDAWESAHVYFEVTILRCDACTCIIHLLVLLYILERILAFIHKR